MRVITLLIWAAVLFLGDFGYKKAVEFSKNDMFKIQKIKIAGDYVNLKSDIIDPVINLKGKNIWYIDEKEIEEKLKKDVRINSVNIKKEYPDSVIVEIKEREPYIYCVLNGKIYLADKNGVVYGYRQENMKSTFPVIYMDSPAQKQELFEAALKSCSSIFKDYISSIYIDKGMINIVLKDGVLLMSDKNVPAEKYNTGAKLYLKLKEDGSKISYIDIRFKDIVAK